MTGPNATSIHTSYDAFISYNHDKDRPLAIAIQNGLQRFAKKWWRRRALRVFRDEANLSASPSLWSTVQNSLEHSRFFILIASPESAHSPWVAREISHWLELGRRDQLLVVLSGGHASWAGSDFDWRVSTALSPALRRAFRDEPLFVDLTWARMEAGVSPRDPRMQTPLATLAAPIHGRPLDALIGDDLREHRRTKRVVRRVVAGLTALLLTSIAASIIAVQQRGEAIDQRNTADERARLATGRKLSAEAVVALNGNLDIALLMAAQAYAVEPNAAGAAASLFSTITRSPKLVGYLPDSADATAVTVAADQDLLAVGHEDGNVTLWHAKDRKQLRNLTGSSTRPIRAMAFSRDGRRLIGGDDSGAYSVWQVDSGAKISGQVSGRVSAVALDEDGSDLAIATEDEVTWGAVDSGADHVRESGWVLDLAFDDDRVIGGGGQGNLQVWQRDTGELISTDQVAWGQPVAAAFSPDFRRFAGATIGQDPYILDLENGGDAEPDIGQSGLSIDDMAFDPTGDYLGVSTRAGVVLWDVATGRQVGSELDGLPGNFVDLAVEADGRVVVGVGERGVAIWDLDSRSPLIREIRPSDAREISDVPRVLRAAASAVFSVDGRRLAWTMLDPTDPALRVVAWDLESNEELARILGERVESFSPDGARIATSDFLSGAMSITDLASGTTVATATIPWAPPCCLRPGAADQPAQRDKLWEADNAAGIGVAVSSDGTLTLWDVRRAQTIGEMAIYAEPDAAALTFDSTGRRLAVAATGGMLTLVDTDPASWWRQACSMAGRTMTLDEEQNLVGGLTLPAVCPAGT